MQVNIKNLIDDVQCYETVRKLRWLNGIECPSCESNHIIKRGFDDSEQACQRYECKECRKRFDDLSDTIFAGHHKPLKVWILCLYFMGLNLSNKQIAKELDLNRSDVQQMTIQLREGIVKKFFGYKVQNSIFDGCFNHFVQVIDVFLQIILNNTDGHSPCHKLWAFISMKCKALTCFMSCKHNSLVIPECCFNKMVSVYGL